MNNLNNISIKNIFSNNINLQNNNSNEIKIQNFSVDTLVDSNTFKTSISDDFLINKIKVSKQNEINKTNDIYEIKYKECLTKIDNAIELNLTDIIFNINISYFGYKYYNSIECLQFIQRKLKEKNFLTMIISNNDIFISWKHFI